jgi:hypothetical protein
VGEAGGGMNGDFDHSPKTGLKNEEIFSGC